jgi:hypothetical protein
MRRSAGVALLVAAIFCAAPTTPALAGFGPIELQSASPLEQFEEASAPAISADGDYLAFAGRLDGVSGVFRKDLQTGQLQLVAVEASEPSISEEGRYVSFTTSTGLVKAAKPGDNVYVRDMDRALPGETGEGGLAAPREGGACAAAEEANGGCPYELASALNDSSEGLTYSSGIGAIASGGVSLSSSGREIAFVIQGESNLTSEAGGSTEGIHTPGMQVAVRYLGSKSTVLVSAERDPNTGEVTQLPVAEGALTELGAALSGDGSTVAWLGAHIPAQAPTLDGERQKIERDDQTRTPYDEPLWRRIADGPSAPTRRMVGGGDPLAPGCPPEGTLEIPACRGPYPELDEEDLRAEQESHTGWLGTLYDGIPALSEDGWTAALIGDPDGTSNVYVVNMQEGLDRVQALRQLTREIPVPYTVNPGDEPQYVATAGNVYQDSISPDGTRIAFTTQREQFPLAPPNFDETPLTQLGVAELYQIDLADEALVRVTHGLHDGPSLEGDGEVTRITGSGASSASYSKDDLMLAFADTASNLVWGDLNGASDVFTVNYTPASEAVGSTSVGPAPAAQQPSPQWRLSVVPVTHTNGTATLEVLVPGAGRLAAAATAMVTVRTRRSHAAERASARRAAGTKLERRAIASTQAVVAVPGLVELPLRVASQYAGALATAAGIYTTVRVTFTGEGGPALTQTVVLSLRRATPKAGKSAVARKNGVVKSKRHVARR